MVQQIYDHCIKASDYKKIHCIAAPEFNQESDLLLLDTNATPYNELVSISVAQIDYVEH